MTGLWQGDVAGAAMRMPTHVEFYGDLGQKYGFELEPGQLEGVRTAFDGLAPRPDSQLFGFEGAPPLEALDVLVMPAGVRSGKSMLFGAAKAVYQACTVDVRGIAKPREDLVCSFFAPKQSKAVETLGYALGMFEAFAPWMIVGRVSSDRVPEEFWVRSPFGPLIHFAAFGFDAGGLNARGRWHLNSVFEEFAFAHGEGYKFNDADLYDAVVNRLAPGGRGKLQIISSPWAKTGKLWSLADDNWAEPFSAVVLSGATDELRCDPDVLAKMAKAKAEYDKAGTPEIYDREWRARFLGLGSRDFYDEETRALACPWGPKWKGGAVDPELRPGDVVVAGGDLAFSSDHAALVIVRVRFVPTPGIRRVYDPRRPDELVFEPTVEMVRHFAVLHVEELAPPEGGVLEPTPTLRHFASVMRRFRTRFVMADTHYKASLLEALKGSGIVVNGTDLAPDQLHKNARDAMRDGRVALLDDGRLLHQLGLVKRRPVGGGRWAVEIPRGLATTGGAGGHGDVAVAFATALAQGVGGHVKAPPVPRGTLEALAEEERRKKRDAVERAARKGQEQW